MSDISLSWGPADYLIFALISGAPGIGVGVLLGALLWRARRFWGAGLGAVAGLAIGLGGFAAWDHSRVSVNVDFRSAVMLWLGLPGLAFGAAICGWRWRLGGISWVDLAVLAGGVAWLGGWWVLAR